LYADPMQRVDFAKSGGWAAERKGRFGSIAKIARAFCYCFSRGAIGIAFYQWKFSPIERQLSATIVGFEVTRNPDEARTPPIKESLAATVTFANGGTETESISRVRFLVSSKEDLSIPETEISKRPVWGLLAGRPAAA
jgi:hypothetical protein